MSFARALWKLLVGIKDGLVLIFMILFFGLLYVALSAAPAQVREGVLWVDLDGVVVEEPSAPDPLLMATGLSNRAGEYRLRTLVEALREAREDDRIKAVALDLDGFLGGGQAALGELADAIEELRKDDKPVIAFATAYSDDAYQLASHASEIWLNPMGAVAFAGPGGSSLYYGEFFDRIGVTANVYRAGDYKSAVEPYTRSDMSEESRANRRQLAGALLESWREDVAAARPKAQLDLALDDPVGMIEAADGDLSRAALMAGLVDQLASRTDYVKRLAELGGEDGKGGFRHTLVEDYAARMVEKPSGKIGVVTVAGTIVDGTAGPGTAAGASIAMAIEEAAAQRDLDALIVRIDSPGGSALASERIRQAILAVKAKGVPVVASFGNVAASGGYWVATAADKIVAEPSSITGSIGVFAMLPSFEGSLEKLGIGADGVATTPLSGQPDLLEGLSPAANAFLQAGVEDVYKRFLTIVSEARDLPVERVDAIGGGRVWDGGSAHQVGLIDRFGGMDEAIALARELADDEDGELFYIERKSPFADSLLGIFASDAHAERSADAFALLAPAPEALVRQALADVEEMLSGPTIQLRCLDCGPQARPASPPPRGWLARLFAG
ncbi:signal peptide peptidase SppA [Sphingomicrobium lutaoense]|uniref:Protease-4 n=1 Tax=Sphingomicrobium lutaoense TaxID=515949 RepID=A0A839Z2N6_9SPHN|nr:signal peptide peptidase SppA [Sphingomicrobium lutaoense]MBB3764317.1 protease-4 [Sphingomicrobium lutaoense]